MSKVGPQLTARAGRTPLAAGRNAAAAFFVALVCLAAILGTIFHRSFEPSEVVFSNDGPLGAAVAQAGHAWYNLRGFWQDLNWVGIQAPGGILSNSYVLFATLGHLAAKFIAPISLLILGMSAWLMFRHWGFSPVVCLLGALAAGLNTNAFSVSCWGLYAWTLARAGCFLALAALPIRTTPHPWLRTILTGFAIGMIVMDGFDVGAILSLYLGAFVLFQALISSGAPGKRVIAGLGRLAIVVICAALLAADGLTALVGTQIKGVVGMQQDKESRERRWAEATIWSLPKIEALRIVIPGLFGYRIPELYGQPPNSVNGANYWGAVGQIEGTSQLRHSGSGEFAGVLVTLVAVWAGIQSVRRKNNPYQDWEQKFIWFWSAAGIVSLLLAFGKHAPFYQFAYALPYLSTIRNPVKFLHPLQVSLLILFGFGLQGLYRRYILSDAEPSKSAIDQFKRWWRSAPSFDRRWTIGCATAVAASLVGWMIYASMRASVVRQLQTSGFSDGPLADSIAGFSLAEVGWFVLFLSLSLTIIALIQCGVFSGRRAKWAGIALGFLLVVDLVRADLPWIVYLDYQFKYQTNPIIDQLRKNSSEHRVTGELMPLSRAWMINRSDEGAWFARLYFEWLQHHFQYYRVQSLDINQMPRVPEFDAAYLKAFRPPNETNLFRCGRLWELTNTRYLLGMTGFLELLNKQIDPNHQRFRVSTAFNLTPKSGVTTVTTEEELTATPDPNGQFALFEFTGALPRAQLFTQWIVNTNDESALKQLADPAFDPAKTVLVANELPKPAPAPGTNTLAGTVRINRYESKLVELQADAAVPSVLLLNDHFNPEWRVYVDGTREELLRCNYLVRGVYLTPGRHTVLFRFQPPATAFYISLTSWLIGLALCAVLGFAPRQPSESTQAASSNTEKATGDTRKAK